MKSTERVILDNVCSLRAMASSSIPLDVLEGMDDDIVANTAKKRNTFAQGISTNSLKFLGMRIKFMELIDSIGAILGESNQKKLLDLAYELTDDALVTGFIIGKYGVNNEYLDPLAAHFRAHRQSDETKDPEIYEKLKKIRESSVNKVLADLEKQGLDLTKIRKVLLK